MATKRTAPSKVAAAKRSAEAMRLRAQGHTFDTIAEMLGYANRSGAYHAVITALKDTLQEPADELRTLEVERLDTMLHALMEKIEGGEEGAINTALRVMERRAKLLGLDQPAKVDVTSGGERITLHWPEYEGEDAGNG